MFPGSLLEGQCFLDLTLSLRIHWLFRTCDYKADKTWPLECKEMKYFKEYITYFSEFFF